MLETEPTHPVPAGPRQTALANLLRGTRGSIDLLSIMVGVIVIGAVSTVVSATTFGVIPWAQDFTATANMSVLAVTESAVRVQGDTYFVYDSGPGSDYRAAEKWDVGLQRPAERAIVDTASCGLSWIAGQLSASGTVFLRAGGDATACGDSGLTGTAGTNAVFTVPDTGVVPEVVLANLPGGIADTVPQAIVDAILNGTPYDFGTVTKPGFENTPLPVYAGESVLGWSSTNLAAMAEEETAFGVRNGMVSTYTDFASLKDFPVAEANVAADRQAALLISWEPWDSGVSSAAQAEYKPTAITAGAFDPYITSWLTTAQTYAEDGTVMVRFAPEMNDTARPWGGGQNGGNTPAEYIAMWRHVHAVKQAVAPDVILMWNPLNFGASEYSMTDMFPGADYVDMLALDGFNWSDTNHPGICGWQSYEDVFAAPIAELKTLAAGKPWGIAEVASAPDNPADFAAGGACYDGWGSWVYDWPANPPFEDSGADWVTQEGWTDMLFQKAHADGALFVNLFHMDKETDWRVSDTETGRAVVAATVATPGWVVGDGNAAGYIKAAAKAAE